MSDAKELCSLVIMVNGSRHVLKKSDGDRARVCPSCSLRVRDGSDCNDFASCLCLAADGFEGGLHNFQKEDEE